LLDQLMRDAAAAGGEGRSVAGRTDNAQWLGGSTPDAVESVHHEQFALAFEEYAMEGPAPSGELARSFARLSELPTKIYGTPQALVSC
jgi:hypothetical protein